MHEKRLKSYKGVKMKDIKQHIHNLIIQDYSEVEICLKLNITSQELEELLR
jgi:hypothetical protein